MRIVGGEWRGRVIKAPGGRATRPTSDRAREAIFDMLSSLLGADLGEGNALDLFAGSGALGLEALSRGASRAVFVEREGSALRALRANVRTLAADARVSIVPADVFDVVSRGRLAGLPFALLFADPPYRIDSAQVARLLMDCARAGLLAAEAVVTWERSAKAQAAWPEGFESLADRTYGDTGVSLARYGGGCGRR